MAIEATLGIIGSAGGMGWGVWAKVVKPYLKKQKKKTEERDNKLNEIHRELRFNSGSSLKDAVFGIKTEIVQIKDRLDSIDENAKLSMNLQGIAFWISNDEGECTYASPGLCKVMGRSESEIKGNTWKGWLHPNDKQRITDAWDFSIKNKAPFDELYSFKKSNGEYVEVWGQAFPKISKNNTFGGILGKLVEM